MNEKNRKARSQLAVSVVRSNSFIMLIDKFMKPKHSTHHGI